MAEQLIKQQASNLLRALVNIYPFVYTELTTVVKYLEEGNPDNVHLLYDHLISQGLGEVTE